MLSRDVLTRQFGFFGMGSIYKLYFRGFNGFPGNNLLGGWNTPLRLDSTTPFGRRRKLHTSRLLMQRGGNLGSKDPYVTLGLSRSAGTDEVKKKFREMAKKNHPDLNSSPDAKQKMADITAAYELLSDPQKRQFYDQTGMSPDDAGTSGSSSGFASGFAGGDASFMFTDFAEMFSRMAGGAAGGTFSGGSTGAARGDDIQTEVSIDFMEAIKGCDKSVHINRKTLCTDCSGSGCASGSSVSSCRHCGGSGVQRVERGPIIIGLPCKACEGSGQIIQHPCKNCKGQGVKPATKKITLDIPAGVRQGMEIRIPNEGHSGVRGGRSGHLFATINIRPHPVFRVVDNDIHADVPITLKQCLLGGTLQVLTLDGPISLTVPSGTPPNAVKILKGKGPPKVDSNGNGNHVIHFFFEMPTKLTSRQVALIEEFDSIQCKSAEKPSKLEKKQILKESKAHTDAPPPPPPPPPPNPKPTTSKKSVPKSTDTKADY